MKFATFCLLVLLASSTWASDLGVSGRGIDFLRICEGRDKEGGKLGVLVCASYLSGLVDGVKLSEVAVDRQDRILCIPKDGVENEQTIMIVTKWLKEHPERLHASAKVSAFTALVQDLPLQVGGSAWPR